MKTLELRKTFLDFFQGKGHRIFPSDTLVPNDQSLLFTSAGMNQFKPYFLGEKKDLKRAASCQKCLRTGDLEKVGKSAYHHTFFEMLGNFSFGDYFKKEAIAYAWEFLLEGLKMKEKDLWVSVYHDDREAYQIWKEKIGIPQSKLIKLGQESNFWPASAPSLGPNGPCGPCSEIFFDRGKQTGCRKKNCNPECSCGRFVEVWNLVFTQFNRVGENSLEPLPQNNIDTGMGLERMACVLQGKISNFQIDIFAPLVEDAQQIMGLEKREQKTMSLVYAIVDHARAVTFAIGDGIYPSNEERGYVIRKIIRKALWNAHLLGKRAAFLYRLSRNVVEMMQDVYPELLGKKETIGKVIRTEEEKFLLTLEEGRRQFSLVARSLKKQRKNTVVAQDLFRFYDTYGLPLELIKEMAKSLKLKVDAEGFAILLQQQKERSRKKSMFDETIFKSKGFSLEAKTEFLGYDYQELEALVLRLYAGNAEKETILEGESGLVILDKTPFYPESGGQLADKGYLESKTGQFKVEEVFKVGEAIVHKGKVIKGKIEKASIAASINLERRKALGRAHTATHLLQAALRLVLGSHIVQQGSLVDEDKFRFDFTHFNRLTDEERKKVGDLVRRFIKQGDRVIKKEVSFKEAEKEGALAFFKDKYQDKVRVVVVSDYSKELCGGTHVDSTAEIGDFEIESESSISSGIRRIKASVGKEAQAARDMRKETEEKVKKYFAEDKKLDRAKVNQIVDQEKKKILSEAPEIIEGTNFIYFFSKADPSSTKKEEKEIILRLSDALKQKIKPAFIFLVRTVENNNIFICSVTDDLVEKGLSSRRFLSEFGRKLSLMGGGSDKIAQGSIVDKGEDFEEKLKEAFTKFIKP